MSFLNRTPNFSKQDAKYLTPDEHKLKVDPTRSNSSSNDVNEEQGTESTAKLECIIKLDNNTSEILADKVVKVSEQSKVLDFKTVFGQDIRRSLESLGMVEFMRAVIFITSYCSISRLK